MEDFESSKEEFISELKSLRSKIKKLETYVDLTEKTKEEVKQEISEETKKQTA